ncbi:MAG: sensor histidine kinase [Campylobacteraceae bacterium]|jgi:signal transduction histidine kinase|nr:sensor histidine kinase [Campylobacteraceae bacterium]
MKSYIKIFILLLVINFAFAEEKQVLVINSYHRGFQWSDDVIKGLESILSQHIDITINVLYMDSKRINSQEYYKKLLELYKLQLQNRKYDLIVVIDKFAYDFILQYYYELFTNEPILFSGLERNSLEEIKESKLEDKVFGVYERRAIGEIIAMISKMIPNLKKLYIINDQSENGDDTNPFILEAIKENEKNINIEYIRTSTLEEIEERFSSYKKDEAIFYIRFYNDKYGNFYRNNQIATTLEKVKLPIFVTDTLFMGKGALGGQLVLIDELGQETGRVAIDILEGKLKPLFTTTFDKYTFQFDLNKIKEFNLHPSLAVKDYTIINIPQTFFDRHREFINFVFIISPLLVFLILGLLHNIYMRVKNEKKLRLAELEKNKHRQFVIQQSKLAEIGEVFSSIAHQWKNPLVEIATIAQEHAFKERDKNSQFVKDIMVQIRYMTDTMSDFQKFIAPSSVKISFNVEEAIKSMMKIINHTIKYNYIDIVIDKKEAERLTVYGYKNEFMQILLNIVNNAKDQITELRGKRAIKRGQIEFFIYNKKELVIIEISDNAGGIKEDMLPHIFDVYFTTKKNGHGIGLYMSKLIIENKMGGKIEAFNKKDGACFRISLEAVK